MIKEVTIPGRDSQIQKINTSMRLNEEENLVFKIFEIFSSSKSKKDQ
jgi:hypothetical protein